ncbi:MAG: pseudouridine synthase [Candidatus Bathyarchaeota archaeon]|jgi:predicted RNA-binding protein (TIGR00451 family)|nr:pseudouridine synthase [Candidatus Bathyarchaeota archaeon]
MDQDLRRIRAIADYQFGPGCGAALFPEGVSIERSMKTGKIRLVRMGDVLLASLRPTDGLFTLTIAGAERLVKGVKDVGYAVTVLDEVSEFVSQGRNVFAKHVVDSGEAIRPGDEVIILNSKREVLGVGRALLNREEMLAFDVGVAVKTRRGRARDR